MQVEDEVLNDLQSMERTILDKNKELKTKNKELKTKDKVIQNALNILIKSGISEEEARKQMGLE